MHVFTFYSIGKDRLDALIRHYKANGLVPREKKSGGRRDANKKLLTFEDVTDIKRFITNHADVHALALPGRVPGFKRTDLLLLPTAHTRVFLYTLYKDVAQQRGKIHYIELV